MENRGSRSLSLLLLKFTQLAEGRDLIQTQFHQNSHAQTIDQQGQDVSIWQGPSDTSPSNFTFSEGGARLQFSSNPPEHQSHLVTSDKMKREPWSAWVA